MGRNGQPIDILTANGKKHLTKEEIQQRKDSEIKTGTNTLRCPDYVKRDIQGYKKWKEIIKIYKDVDFVSSGDIGMLARYCMTHSEYIELLERKKRINRISEDSNGVEDYILGSDAFNDRVKRQLLDMISTDAILQLDSAINKKNDLLNKLEDRSFLNPLAKVKNIPQKPKENKTPSRFSRFGAGKNA